MNKKILYLFQKVLTPVYRLRIVFLVCLMVTSAAFAAGTLDSTFGNGGKVNVNFLPTSEDFIGSAALQPDGKILLVGRTEYNHPSYFVSDMVIVRLNQNGTLDSSFGSSGWVTADFGFSQSPDSASAVFVQPDGKIVIGGYAHKYFGIARLNPDGSLDNAFGNNGKVVTDFPASSRVYASYLYPKADGKFVAAGTFFGSNEQQIAIAHYNSDGSLDSAFGSEGKTVLRLGRYTYFFSSAMQSDGKILISGRFLYPVPGCVPTPEPFPTDCERDEAFILRLDENLSLDRKFGKRFGKDYTGQTRLAGLTSLSDGRILASDGVSNNRYSAAGRFETRFENPLFPNQTRAGLASALTQGANGTLIGCGHTSSNGFSDMGVVIFNGSGQVIATDQRDFFGGYDSCTNILLQTDGKILVAGRAQLEQNGRYSLAVMRYSEITP